MYNFPAKCICTERFPKYICTAVHSKIVIIVCLKLNMHRMFQNLFVLHVPSQIFIVGPKKCGCYRLGNKRTKKTELKYVLGPGMEQPLPMNIPTLSPLIGEFVQGPSPRDGYPHPSPFPRGDFPLPRPPLSSTPDSLRSPGPGSRPGNTFFYVQILCFHLLRRHI